MKLGLWGGVFPGLIFFGASLLEKNAVSDSFLKGLTVWVGIILLFGIGFLVEEYIKPKQQFKRVNASKYSFLHENQFVIVDDFSFNGQYKGFWFRVLTMTYFRNTKKDIIYDLIQAFYTMENVEDISKKEQVLSGNYFLGKLSFSNNCVTYLPKDWKQIDFKDNFDGLINILNREKLHPLSIKKWEEQYGKNIEEYRRKDIEARTMQILKIGKILDIKYIKPEKKINL